MSLRQIKKIILSLALLLLSGWVGFVFGSRQVTFQNGRLDFSSFKIINKEPPTASKNIDFSLFWEVWDRLERSYLEKKDLDPQKMVYGAIAGMTQALGDPYTVFLPPSENKASKEDLNGTFEGVGIQLGYKDGNRLAVVAPLAGTPAEKAGIKAGDLILHIKDESKNIDQDTTGLTLPEAVKIIRGPKGTTVVLTLLHEKEEKTYEAVLKREQIIVSSVEVKFGNLNQEGRWEENKEGKIAWLKLLRFGELTPEQWDKAVEEITPKLQAQNPKLKGIILDLRNNPGGYLEGAVNLASEFLEKGQLVVKQENTGGAIQEYKVSRFGRLTKVPLVVLVNKGSASASEILAGALQDWNRAKIVGEQTFGKGTIQEAQELREGAGLHVTVAKWLLPKGRWIHKEGIKPDVEVAQDEKDETRDLQLEKAAEVLLKI